MTRKQALPLDKYEAVPEKQAAWLAEIIASSDDAIIGKNLRGIVTSWNRGAQRLFGYHADEAVGRSILFLIPPDHRQEEKIILAKIAAGEHVDHYETVRLRKDGSKVDVSLTISPIKNAAGKIIGASKIARDISGRIQSVQLLLAANAALLESEKQILAVSDEERLRIGGDLHDDLGQQLTAIELLCNSLREDLRQPQLKSQIGQICLFLQNAISQTHLMARGLMPVSLNGEGLSDALVEMVLQMNRGAVKCEFVYPSPLDIGNNTVATHLFRIAQEAVNNAVKHARARHVIVTLTQHQDAVLLRIEDNGRGLSKSKKAAPTIGLRIMQHRARVIGASLETKSIRGKGVVVICTLKNAHEEFAK
jgi:PAS domain S-box-containing protein